MQSIPFLTIDKDTISLSEALEYLRHSGSLPKLIGDVLRQYFLRKELQSRGNIEIDEFQLDQAIMDFRLKNQLLDGAGFEKWLNDNTLTYDEFQKPFIFTLKVETLKNEVTEPKLEAFFNEKKSFYDRIVISRIIVADKALSEKLKEELFSNPKQFEELAKEYSIAHDRVTNGMMGSILRGTLPTVLKTAIDDTSAGSIIGPLEIEGCYGLFRVDNFLPATLDDQLKQELKSQIFEQWIQDKIQEVSVKLEAS